MALTSGCAHVMTPQEVKTALEQRERAWKESVTRRYDLEALLVFVRQAIVEKKNWDGVDLSPAKIGAAWTIGGQSMMSGDWYFSALDPEKDEFTLRSNFRHEKRSLDFKCVRDGKSAFRVIDIVSEDFPDTLIPFTNQRPNQHLRATEQGKSGGR